MIQTLLASIASRLPYPRDPEDRFWRRGLLWQPHINCSRRLRDPERLDLVTIAFNNTETIRHQLRLLQKNLKDPFSYTVADNSTDPVKQEEIFQLCLAQGTGYIRLPPNPYTNPSESHGAALTWVYRHYLRPRRARYFGFLDHDIFPVRPTQIIEDLGRQGLYGHLQTRRGRWYLWPGFCFFDSALVRDVSLDFRPRPGVDTGGGLWEAVYARLDRSSLELPKRRLERIGSGTSKQADYVEWIGDWLHTINASGWAGLGEKERLLPSYLQRFQG